MFWFIASLLGLTGGALYLKHEADARSTRTPPQVGGDDPPPPHGRTAKCGKPSGFGKIMMDVIKTGDKLMIAAATKAFTGGAGAKELNGLVDKVMTRTGGGLPERDWINAASNEEVLAWGIGTAPKLIGKVKASSYVGKEFVALKVTPTAFTGLAEDAAFAAFRCFYAVRPFVMVMPPCVSNHVLQAYAIIYYGGPGVVPVLEAVLKGQKREKDPLKAADGVREVMRALEEYKATQAVAVDAEVGGDVPSDAALRAELLEG